MPTLKKYILRNGKSVWTNDTNALEDTPVEDCVEDIYNQAEIAERVKNASKKGHVYSHPEWHQKLWTWKYNDIIEYLANRFQTTSSREEYYNIMPFLVGHADSDKLLRAFPRRFNGPVLNSDTLLTSKRRPYKFLDRD